MVTRWIPTWLPGGCSHGCQVAASMVTSMVTRPAAGSVPPAYHQRFHVFMNDLNFIKEGISMSQS